MRTILFAAVAATSAVALAASAASAAYTFPSFSVANNSTTFQSVLLPAAPASVYNSGTVTFAWDGNDTGTSFSDAWSIEARVGLSSGAASGNVFTPVYPTGAVAYLVPNDSPTTGGASTANDTTLTFAFTLDANYTGGTPLYFNAAQTFQPSATTGNVFPDWTGIAVTLNEVPEPATLGALAGVAGLGFLRRRAAGK